MSQERTGSFVGGESTREVPTSAAQSLHELISLLDQGGKFHRSIERDFPRKSYVHGLDSVRTYPIHSLR